VSTCYLHRGSDAPRGAPSARPHRRWADALRVRPLV